MTQLGLQLTERISYEGKGFVVHHGVQEAVLEAYAAAKIDGFACRFFVGAKRTGKTHMSVRIAEAIAADHGLIPRFIDGAHVESFFSQTVPTLKLSRFDAFIIDDMHEYFQKLSPGMSGPFVSFYEAVRVAGGKLYFFSAQPKEQFLVDEHILSRLNASVAPELVAPAEEEIPALINALARQRGIKLKDKKIGFVSRRVPRDIVGIENYLSRVLHLSKLFGTKIEFPILGDAV
jgi:chromosomal replication initiation ATPase DnaA